MNPSKADRKSGQRIYLNRCLLVGAHGHIGHVLAAKARYQEAEDSFRRAVALGREQLGETDPDHARVDLESRPFMRALHGLGLVLEKQGAWQEAERLATKVIERLG